MSEDLQRRYTLLLLFLVSMFNYVDRTIISILQVPIKRDLGLSDAQLGALTGLSFAIVYSTLSLPVAYWADRSNRVRIIAASLALWSVMTALTGLAAGFAALVLLRIGVAVGEAGSVPSTHSIVADLYAPARRATVLALWGLSLPAGMAFGYVVAGQLEAAVGWRATFAIVGIAGVALAPLVFLSMREPVRGRFDPPAQQVPPAHGMAEVVRHLWGLRTFRYIILAGACQAYAQYSVMNWNAPFYGRVHGMPLAQISLYLALLNGLCSAVGMYAGGRLSDHMGQRDPGGRLRVVAVALIAMTPFALAQYLTSSAALSLAFGAVASTLMMFYFGPIVAVPQLLVPSSMRAFTSAVVILTFNLLGLGLGPFVTGLLSDLLATRYGMQTESIRYAICSATLFSLVAGGLFWRAASHLQRETPRARPHPTVTIAQEMS
ncbi:Predicted arabinose efflux permease, MFS family [Aromatoleum tolulyticum]|uniref:Predicted arabinose efflux permease, MFS family n=1 Tax=Aromatoleum tolulyticum TaxID=34027 RepID=A0A1N6PYW5_9RHOO|nr:MFS transporter [Aromatoleum tolulyticum]SIQ09462.1 Predicted arabinose efflux permease, MFS family [Aromatoleum tolulyticum]